MICIYSWVAYKLPPILLTWGRWGKQRNVQVTQPSEPQRLSAPEGINGQLEMAEMAVGMAEEHHQQWGMESDGGNVGGCGAQFAAANESGKITFLLFSNFVASCNLCRSQMLICGSGRGSRDSESRLRNTWTGHRPHNAEPPPYWFSEVPAISTATSHLLASVELCYPFAICHLLFSISISMLYQLQKCGLF